MNMLLHPVAVRNFLNISDGILISRLQRQGDSSYNTIFRMIKNFERIGLVKTSKVGRTRPIYLTKKGILVQGELRKIC